MPPPWFVWWRRCSSLLALALLPVVGWCDDSENAQTIRSFLQDAQSILRQCEQIVDRSDFEPAALAASLGNDVATVFEFVRDGIAYQPYAGALRGADGALRSRAGNAVDKSLLLAELLRHGGHEVRLVNGSLTTEQAVRLVEDSLLWETDEESADLDLPYGFDHPDLVQERAEAIRRVRERLSTRLARLTPVLQKALTLSDTTAGSTIDAVARDVVNHTWVQIRQGENWQDLDPSVAVAQPGETLAEPHAIDDTWLKNQWHRVEFRGIVERCVQGKIVEEQLWAVPYRAAELSGLSIVASCSPELDGVSLFGTTLAGKAPRCLRLFVEGRRVAGVDFECTPPPKPVTEESVFVPSFPFGAPAPAADNEPFVIGVLVEIVVESPGQTPVKIRRHFLDLWPAAARAKNDTAILKTVGPNPEARNRMDQLALSFAVETGVVSPAWIQLRAIKTGLEKFNAISVANERVAVSGAASDALLREFGDAYFHLRDKLAAELFDQPGFAHQPRIVMVALDASNQQSPQLHFDITHDPQRFLREGLDQPADTLLKAGLLAAIVEEELSWDPLEPTSPGPETLPKLFGGAHLLEQSLPRGPPLTLAANTPLPPATEAAAVRMTDALKRGRILVAPRTDLLSVWFEYDPATGWLETTSELGYHHAATERASLEGKNPKKTAAAMRFREVVRAIKRCFVNNIDMLIEKVAAQASGTLSVDDVIDGLNGARACIQKSKSSKFKSKSGKSRGSQKWDTGKNADKLRQNMDKALKAAGKKPLPKAHHAHHVVSSTHRKAWEARGILNKYGIDINDAANGVGLTGRQHSGVHTGRYMSWVTDTLRNATSKESARDLLKQIADTVKSGARPWNKPKYDNPLWNAVVRRWLDRLDAFFARLIAPPSLPSTATPVAFSTTTAV